MAYRLRQRQAAFDDPVGPAGVGKTTIARLMATAAESKCSSSVDFKFAETVLTRAMRRFDKGGDNFYAQMSALHKSVRGSDPDASLYWFCR